MEFIDGNVGFDNVYVVRIIHRYSPMIIDFEDAFKLKDYGME